MSRTSPSAATKVPHSRRRPRRRASEPVATPRGDRSPRFWRNVVSYAGANTIGSALQLVLLTVLARYLNLEHYAAYLTAAALVGIGEMASDFGCRVWAIQQFSHANVSPAALSRACACKCFFSVVAAALLCALPTPGLTLGQIALCLLIAVTQPSTDPLLWNLRGRERLELDSLIQLAWRAGTTVGVATLAIVGTSMELLLAAWLGCNLLRVGGALLAAESRQLVGMSSWERPSRETWQLICTVFPIGVAMLSMTLFYRLGVLGLSQVSTPANVAVYGSAFTLASSLGFISTGITAALFPRLAKVVASRQADDIAKVVRSQVWLIGCTIGPICVAGIVAAPWLLRLLFGAKFENSGHLVALMMPCLYVSCINAGLKFLLNAMELNWADAASVWLGIVATLLILAVGALWWWPPYVAAASWMGGEATILVVKLTAIHLKDRNVRVPWLQISLCTLVLCLLTVTRYVVLPG